MDILYKGVIFFVILSFLVLIHELGHFFVALFFGMKVEEFGLGLPPRIKGKKYKNIIFSVNWLPIGGFVRLNGEDMSESMMQKWQKGNKSGANWQKYFFARPTWQRAAVLLAGVTMNFLFAVGITAYLLAGPGVPEPSGQVYVETVASGSPAETAGLQPDDVIQRFVTIEEEPQEGVEMLTSKTAITETAQLIDMTKEYAGQTVILEVIRGGDVLELELTPREEPPEGEGAIGISISDLKTNVYPVAEAIPAAFRINIERSWQMLASLGGIVGRLLRLQSPGAELAGPIGIAKLSGEVVEFGFLAILEFMSILSLNLAVLNLLPIPALDGGRLLFVLLETIKGGPVAPKVERIAHQYGLLFLLSLLLLVSINDILRIVTGF